MLFLVLLWFPKPRKHCYKYGYFLVSPLRDCFFKHEKSAFNTRPRLISARQSSCHLHRFFLGDQCLWSTLCKLSIKIAQIKPLSSALFGGSLRDIFGGVEMHDGGKFLRFQALARFYTISTLSPLRKHSRRKKKKRRISAVLTCCDICVPSTSFDYAQFFSSLLLSSFFSFRFCFFGGFQSDSFFFRLRTTRHWKYNRFARPFSWRWPNLQRRSHISIRVSRNSGSSRHNFPLFSLLPSALQLSEFFFSSTILWLLSDDILKARSFPAVLPTSNRWLKIAEYL